MLRLSASRFLSAILAACFSACIWPSAHAALVLGGLTSDAHAVDNPTPDSNPLVRDGLGDAVTGINSASLRTGLAGSTGSTFSQSIVFVFQLPTLAPSETISGGSLNFTFLSYQTAGSVASIGNIDLYGLGYRSTSDVREDHYYHGALDTTDATLLQDNLLAPTGLTNNSSITSNASSAIAAFINAQYLAGAQPGDYIFLRLSADATAFPGPAIGARGYNIASADSTTASQRPSLTLDIVPEPSRAIFALLGFTALALRRSRRLS